MEMYGLTDIRKRQNKINQKDILLKSEDMNYQVPYSAWGNNVRGKKPLSKPSGPPILSQDVELNLAQWMMNVDAAGFPITKSQFLDSVQKLLKEKELEKYFVNGKPDTQYYESFMQRHPQLLERTSPNTYFSKVDSHEQNKQDWFQRVYKYLEGIDLHSILQIDNRVFICEEFTLFLNQEDKSESVIKRGEKTAFNVEDKERMTTVLLANAAGTLAPPMVISKSQRLSKLLKDSIPVGWEVGRSETGWATSENFLDYILKVFYPWLMNECIKLPIILFLDATVSPLSFSLSEFCQKYGIILIALYASDDNTPRPLDITFYPFLEKQWTQVVVMAGKNTKGLKKEDFCPLFRDILLKVNMPRMICTGFEKCGLFPFGTVERIEEGSKQQEKQEEHVQEILVRREPVKKIDENERLKKLTLLRGIEEMIGEKKGLFESCFGKWKGKLEDTSLFELWSQLKRDSGETPNTVSNMVIVKTESNLVVEDCQILNDVNTNAVKTE